MLIENNSPEEIRKWVYTAFGYARGSTPTNAEREAAALNLAFVIGEIIDRQQGRSPSPRKGRDWEGILLLLLACLVAVIPVGFIGALVFAAVNCR